MEQDIGVAMPQTALVMRNMHTAQHERTVSDKAVRIGAEADTHGHSAVSAAFFALPSKLRPSVKRKVFANGLCVVLAMR